MISQLATGLARIYQWIHNTFAYIAWRDSVHGKWPAECALISPGLYCAVQRRWQVGYVTHTSRQDIAELWLVLRRCASIMEEKVGAILSPPHPPNSIKLGRNQAPSWFPWILETPLGTTVKIARMLNWKFRTTFIFILRNELIFYGNCNFSSKYNYFPICILKM
jgi:hypothetical protein